jgi:hypothetical protein
MPNDWKKAGLREGALVGIKAVAQDRNGWLDHP